jgi:hypothetical protein
MIKPKRKRPTDAIQLAHSVFVDVIKLAEKSIKAPKQNPKIKKSGNQGNSAN